MPSRIETFEAMVAQGASDPFVLYALAMEYRSAGRPEEAVTRLRELVAQSPDYVPGHHMLAQTLTQLGRAGEAREALRAGIAAAARKGDLHAKTEMEAELASLA